MSTKRSRVHPKYKTKYRVTNWPEYDRGLVDRGDLTLWISPEAIATWRPRPSGARGGQRRYQIECALVRAVAPHYRRSDDEGRTLVHTALLAPADIDVTHDELRITLAPLSSAHRSRAVTALCDLLNATPVRFPGSRLQLRFAVADGRNRTDG